MSVVSLEPMRPRGKAGHDEDKGDSDWPSTRATDNPVESSTTGTRCKFLITGTFLTAALTLTSTTIVGALYGGDRVLVSYCDSSISVYTFPLGYAVTSQGVGHKEVIALSGFLERCRQQNEFTVPARVKFHKAIKCFKTRNQYKRTSSGASSNKDSRGSRN